MAGGRCAEGLGVPGAVLVCVMRLDSLAALSMVPGAWSVSCADWRSCVFLVRGVRLYTWSLAVPGVWGFLRVTLVNVGVARPLPPSAHSLCNVR